MSQSVDFSTAPHNFVTKYRIKSKFNDSNTNFRSTSIVINEREIPKPFIPQKVSMFFINFYRYDLLKSIQLISRKS